MRFSAKKKKNINGEERERKQGNDDIRHCNNEGEVHLENVCVK